MNPEIAKLFLRNTIEIGEIRKLSDSLLLDSLFDVAGSCIWHEFVYGLEAWAKLHSASILVHGDYIQEYLAESAARVIQMCPEVVHPFIDTDAMIAFWLERIPHKSCVYPEPVSVGVSDGTWWFI